MDGAPFVNHRRPKITLISRYFIAFQNASRRLTSARGGASIGEPAGS
jgi:hypothetical protein